MTRVLRSIVELLLGLTVRDFVDRVLSNVVTQRELAYAMSFNDEDRLTLEQIQNILTELNDFEPTRPIQQG